ncbi:MAG: hypothetical protein ACK2U9_04665, partial [Anaerolineae bacterium]
MPVKNRRARSDRLPVLLQQPRIGGIAPGPQFTLLKRGLYCAARLGQVRAVVEPAVAQVGSVIRLSCGYLGFVQLPEAVLPDPGRVDLPSSAG